MANRAKCSAGLPWMRRAASSPRRKAWAGAATVRARKMSARLDRRMSVVVGWPAAALSGPRIEGRMSDGPADRGARLALLSLGLSRLREVAVPIPPAPRPPPVEPLIGPERLAFEQADLFALTREPAGLFCVAARAGRGPRRARAATDRRGRPRRPRRRAGGRLRRPRGAGRGR